MQPKALRYVDNMLTKQPQDEFEFYKALSRKVDDFSPTLLRVKILPIQIEECRGDVRFVLVLLGSIFQMSKKYAPDNFTHFVWVKICTLARVVKSPEISIALLRSFWIVRDKTDSSIRDISQRYKECRHSKCRLRTYRRTTLHDQRSELLILSGLGLHCIIRSFISKSQEVRRRRFRLQTWHTPRELQP
jgi:hypothetical protein